MRVLSINPLEPARAHSEVVCVLISRLKRLREGSALDR